MEFCAFRLSSPHLELHAVVGSFTPHIPGMIACPPLCTQQGLARHSCLSSSSYPALCESIGKSIIFSQADGQSITDVYINRHVFYMRRESLKHTFLARQKVPEDTLAVPSNGLPHQTLRHTAKQCSSHGLCDSTTVGSTAALPYFISFLLSVAFDIRIAGK